MIIEVSPAIKNLAKSGDGINRSKFKCVAALAGIN